MTEILCSKSDEFVYEKDGYYYIGVTDLILNKHKDIQFIEFPSVGEVYAKGEIFGFIESSNIATELYMPLTGKIEELNIVIKANPAIIKNIKIEDCWLIKISSEFFEEDKKDLITYNKYKEEAE